MPTFSEEAAPAMTDAAFAHQDRYLDAVHAMQTGVAFLIEQEPGDKESSPKHLRVGVNSALLSLGGLVQVLIDKGILTPEEYLKAQADSAEREVADYERRIEELTGAKVTLR